MRLIDADELIEHVWRDRLDSRERIADLVQSMPTVKPQYEVRFSDADHVWIDGKQYISLQRFGEAVKDAQPEIIRCEDCMHNGSFDTDCPIVWNGKEYCSFAER